MEIVRDVGLTTCERGVFGQGGRLLSWRKASGFVAPMTVSSGFRKKKKKIGETHGKEQGEEQRVKERTTAQRG